MIKFMSSKEGYVNFAVERSKKLPKGKSARKRFYIGFTMMYFIVWVAIMYYILINGMLPQPFFVMFILIYIIMMIYMVYVDIFSYAVARRAKKDEIVTEIFKLTFDDKVVLSFNNKKEVYDWENVLGFTGNSNFITLFFSEDSGVSIPSHLWEEEVQTKLKEL